MVYKGYIARIEYSNADGCFIGHIAGINDVVGFHVAESSLCLVDGFLRIGETCLQLSQLQHDFEGV